jgi:peptide chain release factor subunit 1
VLPVITEDTIRELAAFRGDAPVTSCYLDVDGRRLVRQQDVDQELEILLRRARAEGEHLPPTDDVARIERFVRGGFDRSRTRGLAIFSCRAPDLWQVVPLPVPVRSRLVVNDQPAVGALKSVVEQYERFGVLLVDRQRARMFVFELGELIEHDEVLGTSVREVDTRGHSERGDHSGHVAELDLQQVRRGAALAWSAYQRLGFGRLMLSAPDDLAAHLGELLHPYLRERLCGHIAATPAASLEEIRVAASEVEARVERAKEAALVGRLRDVEGQGKAVTGLPAVLRALAERRVDLLLVAQGFASPGWRCDPCGTLWAKGRQCATCEGEMVAVPDIVEEALEAALKQACRVEVCVDNADLDVVGRIGALLRY